MKHTKYFIASICMLLPSAHISLAQTQPLNGSFETWSNLNGFDEPAGWATSQLFTLLGDPPSAIPDSTKVTDGSLGIRLSSFVSSQAGPIAAFAFIGEWATDGATFNSKPGVPFSERPSKLKGHYIYKGATSTSNMEVNYDAWAYEGDSARTIAFGQALGMESGDTFTLFELDITYFDTVAGDSMTIFLFASDPTDPEAGDTVWIDYLQFEYDLSGLPAFKEAFEEIAVYPNPAKDYLKIKWSNALVQGTQATILFRDAQGRIVGSSTLVAGENHIDLIPIPSGWMTYEVLLNNTPVKAGRLLKL